MQTQTLDLLKDIFPGQFRLTTPQIAKALGTTHASLRTSLSRGDKKYAPLRTYVVGRRRYADLTDVASLIDQQRATAPLKVEGAHYG